MEKIKEFFVREKIFLIAYALLLPVAFVFFRNFIDSADIFQYLNNAEKYLRLPIAEAANDFWSPLLSWLLIPINFFTGNYLLSFKILQGILVFAGLVQVISFANKYFENHWAKAFFCLASLFLLFQFGFLTGSPDLLFLCILLWILRTVTRKNIGFSRALQLGFGGALLYYSKGFGFVFFACFLFALFAFRKKFYNLPPRFLVVSSVFFLLFTLPWIGLLSLKNSRFTISAASEYNFKIMNPEMNPSVVAEIQHPIDKPHIKIPTGNSSLSAWNNPNSFDLKKWGPTDNFGHYFKIIGRNFLSLFYYYFKFNTGSLFIITLVLASVAARKQQQSKGPSKFGLYFGAGLCTLLYCFILTQKRYLWINEIVFLFFIASCFDLLLQLNKFIFPLLAAATFFLITTDFISAKKSGFHLDASSNDIIDFIESEKMKTSFSPQYIASDKNLGTYGYTLNSAVCFFTGKQNIGMSSADSVRIGLPGKEKSEKIYFISKGPNAIKTGQTAFLQFFFYSKEMDCSLYELK